jgi:hypothetical protein
MNRLDLPQLADRECGHQVGLARARADAEQRQQARGLELPGELELLAGDVVETAQVEVVAARLEAGVHRGEVDPIGGGVDQRVDVGDLAGQSAPRVRGAGLRLGTTLLGGDPGGAFGIDVQQQQSLHLVGGGQVADDRRGDRSPGSEHRHIQRRPPPRRPRTRSGGAVAVT